VNPVSPDALRLILMLPRDEQENQHNRAEGAAFMSHGRSRSKILWLAGVVLVSAASGCSTTGSLFPSGFYLLRSARDIAVAAPQPAPTPRELAKSVLPAYFIEPGDVLLVEPASFDSPIRFPGDQTVLADGTIDLGRYGRIVVAGRTVEDIEYQVQAMVESVEQQRVDPINVRLLEPTSAVFYVTGEVNAPGAYPLIGRETALDGIMTAGGLSERAATHKIVLSRPTPPGSCRVVLPVCYREIVQLGDTTTNYQLRPGDRIFVSTRTFWDELHQFLFPGLSRAPCDGPQFGCPDPCVAVPTGPAISPLPPVSMESPPPPESDMLPLPLPPSARRS
jgi:polysaccharide biosynthesis/export protein